MQDAVLEFAQVNIGRTPVKRRAGIKVDHEFAIGNIVEIPARQETETEPGRIFYLMQSQIFFGNANNFSHIGNSRLMSLHLL